MSAALSLWRTSLSRAAELGNLVARSSGVFCLGPVETEFLAVLLSETFAPNQVAPADGVAFGATALARYARIGAAELHR